MGNDDAKAAAQRNKEQRRRDKASGGKRGSKKIRTSFKRRSGSGLSKPGDPRVP